MDGTPERVTKPEKKFKLKLKRKLNIYKIEKSLEKELKDGSIKIAENRYDDKEDSEMSIISSDL